MAHPEKAVRVGGMWLAAASFLMIIVLAFHGPIAQDLGDQMTRIADAARRWSIVHWTAAAALSMYAVASLIILTSVSRLVESGWTISAWAVIFVGSLWTITTAVTETTVVASAAVAGNYDTFEVWWSFAEGKANGFVFLALAVAVIASNEARHSASTTPTWFSWMGTVAGILSFVGWALGMWLVIGIGNLLWVLSTIVMSLWTFWFGVALVRHYSSLAAA